MSGAQTSTFADPNILLRTLSGQQTAGVLGQQIENQRNQLLMPYQVQSAQQAVGQAEMDTMGRAAAGLLSLPDENARAAAYPGVVAQLQANGFAKNAPAQYPGEGALRTFVGQALPVEKQYELGIITAPGSTDAINQINRIYGGTGGGTGTPDGSHASAAGPGSNTRSELEGGPPAAGTPAAQVAQQVHDFWIGKGFSEEQVAGIMAGGPGSESDFTPSVYGDNKTSYGLYQHHGPRLDAMRKFFGLTGDQMPSADQQNQYAAWEISPQGPLAGVGAALKQAKTPAEAAAIWTAGFGVPADKTEIGRRARGAGRYMGLYAKPGDGSGGAAVVAGQPGDTTVPAPPGGSGGVYAGGGVGTALNPPLPTPPIPPATVPTPGGTSIGTGRLLPRQASNVPDYVAAIQRGRQNALLTPPPPAVATAGPGAPTNTATAVPWGGSTIGDYNSTIAAPAPATPPAPAPTPPAPTTLPAALPPGPTPTASLPHASEVPTGLQSQQVQQAQDLLQRATQIQTLAAQNPYDKRLQATAAAQVADLRQRAQLLMQQDSVVNTQEGQLHTLTGKLDDPAKPLADYRETSPGSGIWVGGPGTEPRFQPPGRLIVTPGGDVYQTTPGGPVLLKHTDPAAVQALEAAKASGASIGTATGKLTDQLAEQGRSSAQAIGNIDYGLNQIQQAKQGGVPTGYFAPWLGTAAAIAKSLGVDTSGLGIDPTAVGNIQTAAKTLAVVSGAILQQVLGPDSQITDAKIQHFIHAQPGIETDPDALNRVLNWARSQFVYEREMAAQGMKDAAANPSGVLPPNWKASYFAAHGFAPIYNPGTGEMEQPEGRAPPRQAPSQPPTAPVNPAARSAGTTYQTPKGPLKWTGTGWVPPGQ